MQQDDPTDKQKTVSLAPNSLHWFVKRLENQLAAQEGQIHAALVLVQKLDAKLDSAFPGADLGIHNTYHDDIIVREYNRAKTWLAVKTGLVIGGVIAFVILIAVSIAIAKMKI